MIKFGLPAFMKKTSVSFVAAARLVQGNAKVCSGRDLAAALAKTGLTHEESKTWRRDLQTARKALKAPK
jgi:hypothetical protein